MVRRAAAWGCFRGRDLGRCLASKRCPVTHSASCLDSPGGCGDDSSGFELPRRPDSKPEIADIVSVAGRLGVIRSATPDPLQVGSYLLKVVYDDGTLAKVEWPRTSLVIEHLAVSYSKAPNPPASARSLQSIITMGGLPPSVRLKEFESAELVKHNQLASVFRVVIEGQVYFLKVSMHEEVKLENIVTWEAELLHHWPRRAPELKQYMPVVRSSGRITAEDARWLGRYVLLGAFYLLMEAVEGETSESRLQRLVQKQLPMIDAIRDMRAIFDTLPLFWARSAYHRDLTPDEIFVRADGTNRIILTDFGFALPGEFYRGGLDRFDSELGRAGTDGYSEHSDWNEGRDRRSVIAILLDYANALGGIANPLANLLRRFLSEFDARFAVNIPVADCLSPPEWREEWSAIQMELDRLLDEFDPIERPGQHSGVLATAA